MTEFYCEAVQLGKIGKHPNADTLSITTVYGRPVIFKSGEFQPGDTAVYIPVDAVVDTDRPEFSWLAEKSTCTGLHRVKATKIRGIPSHGFLVNPDPKLNIVPGQKCMALYGVKKYDPGPCYQQGGAISGEAVRAPQEGIVPTYDIESLRRYSNLLIEGEEVWVSEKIHGSNGRWAYIDGQLYCGSRTRFRRDSVWNQVAELHNLQGVLSLPENHGLVLYGEVYGPGIQDLTYGKEKPDVVFFDVYDTQSGKWYDFYQFRDWLRKYSLPCVPHLYRGSFNLKDCMAMAEGQSTLQEGTVREGIVVKPTTERWNQDIGRVFLKLPGEGYLLRKDPDRDLSFYRNQCTDTDSQATTGDSSESITPAEQTATLTEVSWLTRIMILMQRLWLWLNSPSKDQ